MGTIIDTAEPFTETLQRYQHGLQIEQWPGFFFDDSLSFDSKLDLWEAYSEGFGGDPPGDCGLKHSFPDGMYVRQVTMPAGSIVTSRIHKFENPFFILSGCVIVLSEHEGAVTYGTGDSGITKPGTRRFLLNLEDTTWSTVHINPDNSRDTEMITDTLTYQRPRLKVKEVSPWLS